jgi:cytosine/adenosine deaminase-related metal-dependent hydrolase
MEANMILRGARVAFSASSAEIADIEIVRGRIRAIGHLPDKNAQDFSGYLILPGLINAHDHLEFNLFPRLGNGPYETSGDWARDIRARFKEQINQVVSVPLAERLTWGGIRNLACGVTTVCHHNPWHSVFERGFPVRVVRRFHWSHSLEFSPDLAKEHEACPHARPFVFHAGEAINGAGRREMTRLAELGLFAPNSVLVHAVALEGSSLEVARRNGCSLVWCPSSNLFILGKTLSRDVLDSGLPIALGTDSGLSCEGDMIDELRVGREISGLSEERLYSMVTTTAAKVLRLAGGEGTIREGGVADLLVFRDEGLAPAATLFRQRPEAVFIGGKLQLASENVAPGRFHALSIEGRGSWRGRCRVPSMPPGLRLAGRQVAA